MSDEAVEAVAPRTITWGDIYQRHLRRGEDHGSAAYAADQWEKRRIKSRWKHCPSTHCERRHECTSPSECIANAAAIRAAKEKGCG